MFTVAASRLQMIHLRSGERVQANLRLVVWASKWVKYKVDIPNCKRVSSLEKGPKITVLDLSNDDYLRTGGEDIMSSSVMGI